MIGDDVAGVVPLLQQPLPKRRIDGLAADEDGRLDRVSAKGGKNRLVALLGSLFVEPDQVEVVHGDGDLWSRRGCESRCAA